MGTAPGSNLKKIEAAIEALASHGAIVKACVSVRNTINKTAFELLSASNTYKGDHNVTRKAGLRVGRIGSTRGGGSDSSSRSGPALDGKERECTLTGEKGAVFPCAAQGETAAITDDTLKWGHTSPLPSPRPNKEGRGRRARVNTVTTGQPNLSNIFAAVFIST